MEKLPVAVAILIPLIFFSGFVIFIGYLIMSNPSSRDSLLYKRRKRLKIFASAIGFALDKQKNHTQWEQHIIQTNFTKQLFGNWKQIHGNISPITISGTSTYKDYTIELLWFYIKTRVKKEEQVVYQYFGPYVGIHFNLHKQHNEVDIIYKYSHLFRNIYEKFGGLETVGQRSHTTESPKFNKKFTILSDHGITNLTVLTPDVIELILAINLKINIEINNNHLLIYTASTINSEKDLSSMRHIAYRIAENLE